MKCMELYKIDPDSISFFQYGLNGSSNWAIFYIFQK